MSCPNGVRDRACSTLDDWIPLETVISFYDRWPCPCSRCADLLITPGLWPAPAPKWPIGPRTRWSVDFPEYLTHIGLIATDYKIKPCYSERNPRGVHLARHPDKEPDASEIKQLPVNSSTGRLIDYEAELRQQIIQALRLPPEYLR